MDSNWIQHSCGCNLQLHKTCYVRWLLSLNMDTLMDKEIVFEPGLKPLISKSVKHRISFFLDAHRELQADIPSIQIILETPLIGKTCFETLEIPLGILFAILKSCRLEPMPIATESVQPYTPINRVSCPQCKQLLQNDGIEYASNSKILSLYYHFKKLTRTQTLLLLLSCSTMNIFKWWFNLGLAELRCFFPENALRRILNISTTKALDVYSETTQGLMSISYTTKFLVMGFPLALVNLTKSWNFSGKLPHLWRAVAQYRLAKVNATSSDVVSKTLFLTTIAVASYNMLLAGPISNLHKKWIEDNYDDIYTSDTMDREIHEELKSADNIILRKSWYDSLFESIVWPFAGRILGGILEKFALYVLRYTNIHYENTWSPDENRMIFNFLGCGTLFLGHKLMNLYLTKLRLEELKELKLFVDETLVELDKEDTDYGANAVR